MGSSVLLSLKLFCFFKGGVERFWPSLLPFSLKFKSSLDGQDVLQTERLGLSYRHFTSLFLLLTFIFSIILQLTLSFTHLHAHSLAY